MRSIAEIHELLDRLDEVVADELEDQDLDFNEWKGSVDHMVETGESDVTAEVMETPWQALISPTAMEALRTIAAAEKAPRELLALTDEDFLNQLQLLKRGKLTKAGLLLCGKSAFPALTQLRAQFRLSIARLIARMQFGMQFQRNHP